MAEIHSIDGEALLAHLLLHITGRADAPELKLADDVRKFEVNTIRAAYDQAAETLANWLRAWQRQPTFAGPMDRSA